MNLYFCIRVAKNLSDAPVIKKKKSKNVDFYKTIFFSHTIRLADEYRAVILALYIRPVEYELLLIKRSYHLKEFYTASNISKRVSTIENLS